MKKIVSFFGEDTAVFQKLNQNAAEYAKSKGIAYEWAPQNPFDQEKAIAKLQEAQAGIIDVEPYGEEIFSQIKDSARLLVRFGVGFDKVDLQAATRNGIAISRTPGANTLGVAEMALTLILAARRFVWLNQKCVLEGKWTKTVSHETIGSTVGIVGFGAIGKALAKLLQGFDCKILAYDPYPNEEVGKQLGVKYVALNEIFKIADVISLHVPYMPSTHHLINEKALSLMKETAVVVNTCRGNVIDEDALYHALRSGSIAAAGLDVFSVEPLAVDSPLTTLDNIILTPHVSSQTIESLWKIYKMAIDICAEFFATGKVPYLLNPDIYGGK